jgi:hypothetical protein
MQQAIDIRRASDGRRFDVYPTETIEINMGGISLLNLADRPTTYTNSFKLPRTENNEQIFEFASQPTRNNRPSIEVIITKGLFQRTAVLKVKEFDDDYKCEVSYDSRDFIKKLEAIDFLHGICGEGEEIDTALTDTASEIVKGQSVTTWRNDGLPFVVVTYPHSLARQIDNSIVISCQGFLTRVSNITGFTISGTLTTDPDFLKSFIFNKDIGIDFDQTTGHSLVRYKSLIGDIVSAKDVMKALCQLFFADIYQISENHIEINKLSIANRQVINIETLNYQKEISTSLVNANYIVYDTDKKIDSLFNSDFFTVNGTVGKKDILKINSFIPQYFNDESIYNTDGYDTASDDALKKVMIMSYTVYRNNFIQFGYESGDYLNILSANAAPLALDQIYSSILNPIFANPVLLSANGTIDPLTADTIMNQRIINSVKLGGKYWVDEMKYNLTTGKAVLKLIKL